MQGKSDCNKALAMRPQVIETRDGFAVTDPCLAAQVAKGSGSAERLLEKMDAFFSAN